MTVPDITKWTLPADGPGTDLNGTIDDANVVVNAGNLELTGSGNVGAQIIAATGQTYGAWEIRALLPVGLGYGPDFDLFPASGSTTTGEINIFTSKDGAATTAKQSLKRLTATTYAWDNTSTITPGVFHLYRLEWTPTRVTLLVDGVKTWEVLSTSTWGLPATTDTYNDSYLGYYGNFTPGETGANYIPTVPMKLRMLLNVGVVARTDGSPPTLGIPVRNGSTPQPFKMLVDYVRVYDFLPATTGSGTGNIPFDFVTYGTGATAVYDTAHIKIGGKSAKLSTGSTSATIALGYNTTLGTQTNVYGRGYWYFTARTPAHRVATISNGAGTCADIFITATGVVQLRQNDGTVKLQSTTGVPLNQWVRIEWKVICTTTGASELRVFSASDSSTPDEVLTNSSGNFRGAATTYTIGVGTSVANAGPYWIDSIGWNNTGFLGADGPNNAPVVAIPATFKAIYGKAAAFGPSSAYDPEGFGVQFSWAMTASPSGAAAFNNTQTTQTATYSPTKTGTYTFQVSVADPSLVTTTVSTNVIVKPHQWQLQSGTFVPMKKKFYKGGQWVVT